MTRHIETDNQINFATWFAYQYPKYINNLCSSMAGINLGPITGKRAKQMGYRKGWPDIQLAIPNTFYSGLFIEFKIFANNKKSTLTTEQKEVHVSLRDAGYRVAVCYSSMEAQEEVKEYLGHVVQKPLQPISD